MKKLYSLQFALLPIGYCLLLTADSFSQGAWNQKANFGKTASKCFSINTKGYVMSNGQELWEWDQATNIWTQKANFGGTIGGFDAGFSIGTKGYGGNGQEFWEWDQATNIWTPKANIGGNVRGGAVGFSIGTKGYIGTGYDGAVPTQDFWEWDQATNIWTKKANFGGTARYGAVGFSIGTKGYIGTGEISLFSYTQDFWEWDQATDKWILKGNFPGAARTGAVGFSVGTKGYIGTGGTDNGPYYQDFWEWNPSTNVWTQQVNFGGNARGSAVGLSIGFKGYIGMGRTAFNNFQDFWEFNPCGTPTPTICLITVDSLSDNNIIVWDKTSYTSGDTFLIYRDTANNAYGLIGKVPYDSLSWFTDTVRTLYAANGDPNISSWRYKLAVKESCGISAMSSYHQSIFIQNSSGNFSWNHYQIEGQSVPVPALQNYLFQRDNLSNGNWLTIGTLSASSLSYTDGAYLTYQNTGSWRVRTVWSIACTPTIKYPLPLGTINTTRSNTFKTTGPTYVNETSLESRVNIYPNPNNGSFLIDLKNINSKFITVKMYDVFGRLVYDKICFEKKTEINCNLAKGIYRLQIETGLGRVNRKIIIQ